MKKLAVAVLMMLGAVGTSQAAGDAAAGQARAAVCIGCHGADGNSLNPIWPKLAGQSAAYLEKQLVDYKSGKRKDPMMSGMAMPLNDQDIANLSAFFAKQATSAASGNAELVDAGKKVYQGGNMESGVAACKGCHGPDGVGNPAAKFPAVKGQHAAYVAKQLRDFKSGTRGNDMNGMMSGVAAKMSETEIKAVAEYVAGM